MSEPNQQGYEFNERENEVLSATASTMRTTAIALIALGVGDGISAVIALLRPHTSQAGAAAPLLTGIVMALFGVLLLRPAQALQRVVETKGNDIPNLLEALEGIRGYFRLQSTLAAFAAVLVLLGLVLVLRS